MWDSSSLQNIYSMKTGRHNYAAQDINPSPSTSRPSRLARTAASLSVGNEAINVLLRERWLCALRVFSENKTTKSSTNVRALKYVLYDNTDTVSELYHSKLHY